MSVRTRFAPSPTGALHLGNARVAVFNWLFARHHGGRFVLRSEDTDVERNVAESEARILDDLRWLGLDWDEGPDVGGPHAPYRQSERGPLHREAAERLLQGGRAYRCYCSEADLEALRAAVGEGEGGALRYPGHCRELGDEERARREAEGRPSVIRFRVPEAGDVEVVDEIRGPISVSHEELGDFVILREDGRPTYNFAVVIDDAAMEITHVIRGAGHLSNAPRQALLFDALGHPRPRFVHLPTVLSPEGGKLSKREGSASLSQLRDEGVHPDAIVNYVSLLGWSDPGGEEVLSPAELARAVTLDRLRPSDTTFDPDKLLWLSGRHIARMELGPLLDAVRPYTDDAALRGRPLEPVVEALRTRLTTFSDVSRHLPLLFPDEERLAEARERLRGDAEAQPVLSSVHGALGALERWEAEAIDRAVREAGRKVGARGAKLFHPVRLAVTGSESGPDLGRVLAAVGRELVLERIGDALSG